MAFLKDFKKSSMERIFYHNYNLNPISISGTYSLVISTALCRLSSFVIHENRFTKAFFFFLIFLFSFKYKLNPANYKVGKSERKENKGLIFLYFRNNCTKYFSCISTCWYILNLKDNGSQIFKLLLCKCFHIIS